MDGSLLGRIGDYRRARREHDPALVEAFANGMVQGDELAYAAWRALRPLRAAGKQMFEQALAHGVGSVEDATPELAQLFEQLDHVPDWVDWNQLDRGCVAYWRAGNLVPIVLAYSSVGFGYVSYGGTKALNFTRLLIEPDRAGLRMTETLRWLAAVTTPGGMRRDGQGFRYSAQVRMVHCAVRYGVSRSPKWQWNEWGLPITLTDLFFTSSNVFCANVVEALGRLGVRFSEQEKDDIFALFRYIGYVMGVPNDLNFADRADSIRKNAVVLAIEREPDEANRILLHSLIGYTATATDGYQALPAWLTKRLREKHKLVMAYGLLAHLNSAEFCRSMAVPDSRFKYLAAAAAQVIRLKESVTRRLPHNDAAATTEMLAGIHEALYPKVDAIQMAAGDTAALTSDDEVQSAIRKHENDIDATLRAQASRPSAT